MTSEPLDDEHLAELALIAQRELTATSPYPNRAIESITTELLARRTAEADARADDGLIYIKPLLAWMNNPNRKPPEIAFTAGTMRQAADYLLTSRVFDAIAGGQHE